MLESKKKRLEFIRVLNKVFSGSLIFSECEDHARTIKYRVKYPGKLDPAKLRLAGSHNLYNYDGRCSDKTIIARVTGHLSSACNDHLLYLPLIDRLHEQFPKFAKRDILHEFNSMRRKTGGVYLPMSVLKFRR